ncbi:Fic family protein [Nakamurella endophytica]|uniref:Fic family protein n=1 Tax=Nakamurella endophytica TaxID=1748367 RepID=UPI00357131E6
MLEQRLNGQRPSTVIAAVVHAWLAHIHPFPDGNGRLARILMNATLMRAGLPPAIIRHKTDGSMYIAALAVLLGEVG